MPKWACKTTISQKSLQIKTLQTPKPDLQMTSNADPPRQSTGAGAQAGLSAALVGERYMRVRWVRRVRAGLSGIPKAWLPGGCVRALATRAVDPHGSADPAAMGSEGRAVVGEGRMPASQALTARSTNQVSAKVPAMGRPGCPHVGSNAPLDALRVLRVCQGEVIRVMRNAACQDAAVSHGHDMCPEFPQGPGHFSRVLASAFLGVALPYPTLPCSFTLKAPRHLTEMPNFRDLDRFKRGLRRFYALMHPVPGPLCFNVIWGVLRGRFLE